MVVGGGYIGMEVAAGLVSSGLDVTIILSADRLLNRLLTPQLAAVYERLYEAKGIKLVKKAKLTGFTGKDGKVRDDMFNLCLACGLPLHPLSRSLSELRGRVVTYLSVRATWSQLPSVLARELRCQYHWADRRHMLHTTTAASIPVASNRHSFLCSRLK